jgi:sporulation protein YabP
MENHYLTLENRQKMTISSVLDVDAFDEDNLWANLNDGAIEITGENLNIEKLDLEEGILIVTGKIGGFSYTDKKIKKKIRLLEAIRNKP